MYEVKVESHFSAAHHLLNYKGNCENQHGHNWKVEVYARGSELDNANLLIDFKLLKTTLNKVLDYVDHKDINEVEYFKGISPSSEKIAQFIYDKMKEEIPQVAKVAVWETPTSCASYWEN